MLAVSKRNAVYFRVYVLHYNETDNAGLTISFDVPYKSYINIRPTFLSKNSLPKKQPFNLKYRQINWFLHDGDNGFKWVKIHMSMNVELISTHIFGGTDDKYVYKMDILPFGKG